MPFEKFAHSCKKMLLTSYRVVLKVLPPKRKKCGQKNIKI